MKQEVKIGQTDYSVFVLIRDTSGNAKTALVYTDIDIAYARMETDNDVTTTDVAPANLATPALTDPHLDWGFLLVSDTDHPGLYRLDIADAVFASGAWSAVVTITGTGLEPSHLEFVMVPEAPYSRQTQSGDNYPIVSHADYGNAQLVRSTTPANKLDVSATGEAGLDFDNIKNATGAHTLTNITVPTVTTTGTCTTNSDMRGTDNAALASVLGALNNAAAAGEVTDADTIMAYIKQLINILIGAAGIGTFPSEAGPGDGISLAEVIRAIHADVTGLNGAAMRGTDSAATAAKLLDYIQLLARSDAAITTDNAVALGEINANEGSGAGDFSNQTDAVEAVRDHVGDGTNLTEAGGDGDHLTEAGGDGDHLTAINLPNQTMDITGNVTGNLIGDVTGNVDGTVAGVTPEAAGVAPTATEIVDEWETQSQADPTGFHVNVKEVNDTAQTANDNGADINAILTDTNELQTDDYPTLIAALPTAAEIKTAIEAAGSHLALIKAQTDLVTAARMGALTDWIDGGRLDLILDAILLDTGTTIPGTITTAQNDLDIITGATGVNLLAATQASIDAIEADTNELQTDDYPTLIAALPTAAEIKTAIEAAGSDLDYLVKALVNKAIWTEADGALEMFNDADVSLGSIAGQITTDGTFTTRKRTVI